MSIEQLRAELDTAYTEYKKATDDFGYGNESVDLGRFYHFLNKLTNKSRNLINGLIDSTGESSEEAKVKGQKPDVYQISSIARKTKWIIIGDLEGYKTETQSGSIYDLLTLMESAQSDVESCRKALDITNKQLGEYIGKPEALSKFTGKGVIELESPKKFLKEISKFYQGVDGVDREVYKKLYGSYRQFDLCSEMLGNLTTKFDGASVFDLRDKMLLLDDTLDRLLDVVQTVNVSSSVAKKIGDLIYALADWVSITALYLTKLNALHYVHLDNAKRITEIGEGDKS